MQDVANGISAGAGGWSFHDVEPGKFAKHVRSSVPIYQEAHDLTVQLSTFFLSGTPRLYDLGCSHGELTCRLADSVAHANVQVIGIDESSDLLTAARSACDADNVEFEQASILDYEFLPSSMIVSAFTLQFIKPRDRYDLVKKLWEALDWGGGLLVFEKLRAPDARFEDWMTQLYEEWKVAQGFSVEEVYNKRTSLRGVLEPFSESANVDMLSKAGFRDISSICRYLNFGGFLAIK